MSPRWSTSKETRYFYYECTSVGHRGKEACSIRSIPAKALEEVVLEKINQISQNEILLQRILSGANSKSKKELESLEKEKFILDLRVSQVKAKGKTLVDKLLEAGEEYSRFIKEEMREKEEELKELEEQLSLIKTKIEESKNYLINKEVVKEAFQYFNRIFHGLNPKEKKYLLRLLIKEIIFTRERILIEFFEVPSIEEIIRSSSDPVSFHQRIEWLPRQVKT